jgi:IMP dehydrogenase
MYLKSKLSILQRNMKIVSRSPELTFNDVLLLPGYSDFTIVEDQAKTDISTKVSKKITLQIPICSSPMPQVTETDMAISIGKLGGIGFIHCFQTHDQQLLQVKEVKKNKVKVAVSVSDLSPDGLDHVGHLLKLKTDLICIETAHSFNQQTIDFTQKIKQKYPHAQICVALVVTPEATLAAIKSGADSVRVGIGGGSHCTTRLVTGVGRPQLSAIKACTEIAKKYNVPIISDTGIENQGDIAKAIAFGADCVMIGGLFTGTNECPGEIIRKGKTLYKFSAGMCSNQTQANSDIDFSKMLSSTKTFIKRLIHPDSNKYVAEYSQPFRFIHEGVSGLVPFKGSVIPIVQDLCLGLRRSMWYLGAKTIPDIQHHTRVVVTTVNSVRDNQPRISSCSKKFSFQYL